MDISQQKQKLLDLRSQYASLLESTRGTAMSETQSEEGPTISSIPTHNADAATETYEREADEAFTTDYEEQISLIDRALAKIEDGTYGKCEKCGKPIGDERLEAMPYALLCLEDEEFEEGI